MATRYYWQERVMKNAFKKAEKFDEQLGKVYRKSYRYILKELKDLWFEMLQGGEISKTSLYKNDRLNKIMQIIDSELKKIGIVMNNGLQMTLLDIFQYSYENLTEEPLVEGTFTPFHEQIAKEVVNASYKNAKYSDRIWTNINKIRTQIENSIIETAILGKDFKRVSKALSERMEVSRHSARQIVITETARVHSEATRKSAIDRGYSTYHVLIENDACDDCKQLKNKHFDLHQSDILPAHPFCKCCMIVDIK